MTVKPTLNAVSGLFVHGTMEEVDFKTLVLDWIEATTNIISTGYCVFGDNLTTQCKSLFITYHFIQEKADEAAVVKVDNCYAKLINWMTI